MPRLSLHELSPFVRICGEHQLPPGFRRLPYFIYEHEFVHVLSGQASYRVGRTTHVLVPGDLLLIPPAVFTESWNDGQEPMRYQFVHFDFLYRGDYSKKPVRGHRRTATEMAKIGKRLQVTPPLTLPTKLNLTGDDRLRLLFDRIIDEVARKKPGYELVIKACLLEMLAFLHRRQTARTETSIERRSHAMVDRVVRFLHTNYASPLRLPELAAEAHLNPVYLGRVFQQVNGCSPMTYLARIRVAQAKGLLLSTDLAVKQIGRLVGYNDPYYFGRVFQKLEGMTPLEYRKQARTMMGIELVSAEPNSAPVVIRDLSYFTIPPRRL